MLEKMRTLIFLSFLRRALLVAISENSEPSSPDNYVRVIAVVLVVQGVSF